MAVEEAVVVGSSTALVGSTATEMAVESHILVAVVATDIFGSSVRRLCRAQF